MIVRKMIPIFKPLVEKFPLLSSVYRSARDQFNFMAPALETQWGFFLYGNRAMAQGDFEPKETALVRDLLNEVDVLVNVGANIGYYCCHALSMEKEVIAFEPNQNNVRYLCRNIKINKWSGAEIYPIALSNATDVLEIYGAGTGASILKGWAGISENHVELTPSTTLDLVLADRLKGRRVLVLVDVEGAEKFVLEGAQKLLNSSPKPLWMVEVTLKENQPSGVENNPNFKETFEIFFDCGYRAFTADGNMTPVTANDIKQIEVGQYSLPVYNFIFCESLPIV